MPLLAKNLKAARFTVRTTALLQGPAAGALLLEPAAGHRCRRLQLPRPSWLCANIAAVVQTWNARILAQFAARCGVGSPYNRLFPRTSPSSHNNTPLIHHAPFINQMLGVSPDVWRHSGQAADIPYLRALVRSKLAS